MRRQGIGPVVGFVATAAAFAACGLDVVGDGAPVTPTLPESSTPGLEPVDSGLADGVAPDVRPPETCSWSAVERGAPWPMLGGCVGHRGRTVFRGPKKKPRTIWERKITTLDSSPVIAADDTIFLGANESGLVAFDPDGGRRTLADAGTGSANNVTNTPTLGADGTIYFGAENDVVAHTRDGTTWRFDAFEQVDTSPVVDEDGTVYAGSFRDRLYAIGRDGGRLWEVPLNGDVRASAAIAPTGVIYAGASDRLKAIQRDGGLRWDFSTNGGIDSTPVLAEDGTVYIGTTSSRLHAIVPDGGAKWTYSTRGAFRTQQLPALGPDGTVYAATDSTYLAAIDPADGGRRWEAQTSRTLRTSVIVDADGIVYVAGDDRMYAFEPTDGKNLWELEIDGKAYGFAIGRDGTIYVATDAQHLIALHE